MLVLLKWLAAINSYPTFRNNSHSNWISGNPSAGNSRGKAFVVGQRPLGCAWHPRLGYARCMVVFDLHIQGRITELHLCNCVQRIIIAGLDHGPSSIVYGQQP